ncbi:MAG: restriction endonuclease [Candidatus Jorgensenbacteria bacterium]|nr:restriction endonuclease [Candidatus Jorgensenbacteria bacterium]
MTKRRYRSRDDELANYSSGVLALAILVLAWFFYKNPARAIVYILLAFVCVIIFVVLIKWLRKKHLNNLLNRLKDSGQEDFLKNFIKSFGLEGKKGKGYEFRNHKFDWNRIDDLLEKLEENGVTSNKKDVYALLRYYIQEKEKKFTYEMSSKEPQKLANLSGSDFEKLLYRLFEAMGYNVQHIGESGDQGGDLIAVKGGDKILIQAKCYRDWSTGNAAVQQVVGAMNHYNCNRTMVVTTSHFTSEAITLAKDNKTELISKEQLQESLLKYLKESWF